MSILELFDLYERHKIRLFQGSVLALACIASFSIGYLVRGQDQHPQIVIEQHSAPASAQAEPAPKRSAAAKSEARAPVLPVNSAIVAPPVILPAPASSSLPAPPAPPAVEPAPPPPSAGLIITEVMAGSDGASDDEFVELFNPGPTAVDLNGYSVRKRSAGGSESALVSAARLQGKSIPAGRHFLIGHEGGYRGSSAVDAFWATSNSLAYANNAVVLYDSRSVKMHEVAWEALEKGMSTSGSPTPQNSLQ